MYNEIQTCETNKFVNSWVAGAGLTAQTDILNPSLP
jgi:hypothetical protein